MPLSHTRWLQMSTSATNDNMGFIRHLLQRLHDCVDVEAPHLNVRVPPPCCARVGTVFSSCSRPAVLPCRLLCHDLACLCVCPCACACSTSKSWLSSPSACFRSACAATRTWRTTEAPSTCRRCTSANPPAPNALMRCCPRTSACSDRQRRKYVVTLPRPRVCCCSLSCVAAHRCRGLCCHQRLSSSSTPKKKSPASRNAKSRRQKANPQRSPGSALGDSGDAGSSALARATRRYGLSG